MKKEEEEQQQQEEEEYCMKERVIDCLHKQKRRWDRIRTNLAAHLDQTCIIQPL